MVFLHFTLSSQPNWDEYHEYNKSKVVYIMPGFSNKAFGNESYRELVANALKFVGE